MPEAEKKDPSAESESKPEAEAKVKPETKADDAKSDPESTKADESNQPKDDASSDKPASTSTAKQPDQAEAAAEVVAELQEKKVKKAFMEKFKTKKKKKSGSKGASNEETGEDGADDPNAVYQRQGEIKDAEFLTLRIKKKTVLVIAGLAIGIMWLFPITKWGVESYLPRFAFWNPELVEQTIKANEEVEPEPTSIPEELLKVRIRNNSLVEGAAQRLADFMTDNMLVYIEIVDDFESEYTGVTIVTLPDDTETRTELETLLGQRYELSSPSAELTSDSDYQAVILFAIDEEGAWATESATLITDAPTASDSAEPQ